eukprot:scpid42678/ scgid1938/ 
MRLALNRFLYFCFWAVALHSVDTLGQDCFSSIGPGCRNQCDKGDFDSTLNLTWPSHLGDEICTCQGTSSVRVSQPREQSPSPVCSEFGSPTECERLVPLPKPGCLTALLAGPNCGGETWKIELQWFCPELHGKWFCPELRHGSLWHLAGFRIRLIEETSPVSVFEVIDVEVDLSTGTGISHGFQYSLVSSVNEYSSPGVWIVSRVLSENTNGRFIKSGTSWNLTAQVISLPLQSNQSESLDSDQSTHVKVQGVKSCRSLTGCDKNYMQFNANQGHSCHSAACQRNAIQHNPAVFCSCVPQRPCVNLTLAQNYRSLEITWGMTDNKVSASFFRITVDHRGNSGTFNYSLNESMLTSSEQIGNASRILVCDPLISSFKITRDLNVQVLPNERIHVTVMPMFKRSDQTVVEGEGAGVASVIRPPLPTDPPVPNDKSSSSGTIPGIIGGLLGACLLLLGILLAFRIRAYLLERARQPINVLKRAKKTILMTLDDLEVVAESLVQNMVIQILSKEYRAFYDATCREDQLDCLVDVVPCRGEPAFGYLLYAFRKSGYENLAKSLFFQVTEDVQERIRPIVFPPPPSPAPQPPPSYDCPQVYISYSRYNRDEALKDVYHLCGMLESCCVDVVIDEDHMTDMADNVPQWISEQVAKVQFVIVVLDHTYPLNLSTHVQQDIEYYTDDQGYSRARLESHYLQGETYWGRRNFIIPVQFGTLHSGHGNDVPMLLRGKTRYHLPHLFLLDDEQFQLMVRRILGEHLHKYVTDHFAQPTYAAGYPQQDTSDL